MKVSLYFAYDKACSRPLVSTGPLLANNDGCCVRDYTARLLQLNVLPEQDLAYLHVADVDTETGDITPLSFAEIVELSAYKFPENKVTREKPDLSSVEPEQIPTE